MVFKNLQSKFPFLRFLKLPYVSWMQNRFVWCQFYSSYLTVHSVTEACLNDCIMSVPFKKLKSIFTFCFLRVLILMFLSWIILSQESFCTWVFFFNFLFRLFAHLITCAIFYLFCVRWMRIKFDKFSRFLLVLNEHGLKFWEDFFRRMSEGRRQTFLSR